MSTPRSQNLYPPASNSITERVEVRVLGFRVRTRVRVSIRVRVRVLGFRTRTRVRVKVL